MQVSSFTQVVMHTILSSWGYDAFMAHTRAVSRFYCARKDVFDAAMQRHLGGLVEYTPPVSGMFFWYVPLSVHLHPHLHPHTPIKYLTSFIPYPSNRLN